MGILRADLKVSLDNETMMDLSMVSTVFCTFLEACNTMTRSMQLMSSSQICTVIPVIFPQNVLRKNLDFNFKVPHKCQVLTSPPQGFLDVGKSSYKKKNSVFNAQKFRLLSFRPPSAPSAVVASAVSCCYLMPFQNQMIIQHILVGGFFPPI